MITKLNDSSAALYLQLLQIELVAKTRVRAHYLLRDNLTSTVIISKSNMRTRLPENDKTMQIDKGYWSTIHLPNNVAPTFDTCNISRSYELRIKVGLQHGVDDHVFVSSIPLFLGFLLPEPAFPFSLFNSPEIALVPSATVYLCRSASIHVHLPYLLYYALDCSKGHTLTTLPLLARTRGQNHHHARPSLQRHRSAPSSAPSHGQPFSPSEASPPSCDVLRPSCHIQHCDGEPVAPSSECRSSSSTSSSSQSRTAAIPDGADAPGRSYVCGTPHASGRPFPG